MIAKIGSHLVNMWFYIIAFTFPNFKAYTYFPIDRLKIDLVTKTSHIKYRINEPL